jgi:uncharacterized phage-associated protein
MIDFRKYQEFNIEKIVQIFGYIQKRTKIKDKLILLKLLFFADRLHLRRHFSLITLDTYYALRNGPAASGAINVINKNRDYLDIDNKEMAKLLTKIKLYGRDKRIIEEDETDYLSDYEMEALEFSCTTFGKYAKNELVDITHDYPEWKRYQSYFKNPLASSKLVNINDFFSNPDINESPALQKYFYGKDPLFEEEDYLKEAKQFYLENEGISNEYQ